MPRKYIIFIFFILFSLIINFSMPKKVIDKIGMITVVGYDFVDKNTIKGTAVVPTFLQKGKLKNLVYTDKASMIYENREKLNAQASEHLFNGKLQMALFNKELAKQGLGQYIDYLLRDPSIGTGLYLAVVDGSTNKMLQSLKPTKGAGMYLSDLIEHNIEDGNVPITNLKVFSADVVSKKSDPYLPVLRMVKGNPKIVALAFFDNDRLVDTISSDDAFVFKMLYENISDGQYNLISDKFNVSIQNIDSSRKVKVKKTNEGVEVAIHVNFEGAVREYSKKKGITQKNKLEKVMSNDFKKKAKKLINKFQELNIDPLGIEAMVKSNLRSYQEERFKDVYPTMEIKAGMSFELTEFGTKR